MTSGAGLPYFPDLYRGTIDALAPLDARVLLTVGEGRDLSELGALPGNVRVESWVPQETVLSHASAVVTHGGYGSMLGALAHGVPSVGVPLFSFDQWQNAAAVARAGAGITLDGDAGERRLLAMPPADVTDGAGTGRRAGPGRRVLRDQRGPDRGRDGAAAGGGRRARRPRGDGSDGRGLTRREHHQHLGEPRLVERVAQLLGGRREVRPSLLVHRDHGARAQDARGLGRLRTPSVSSAPSKRPSRQAPPAKRTASSMTPSRSTIASTTGTDALSPET